MIINQELGPMILFDSIFEFSMKHINYLREFSSKSADFPEAIINQIKSFCGKRKLDDNNPQIVVVTNALKNERDDKHRLTQSKIKIFVNSEFGNVIQKIKKSNEALIPKKSNEPTFSLGNGENLQQLANSNHLDIGSNYNGKNLNNSMVLDQGKIDDKMMLMQTSNEQCSNPKASPIFKSAVKKSSNSRIKLSARLSDHFSLMTIDKNKEKEEEIELEKLLSEKKIQDILPQINDLVIPNQITNNILFSKPLPENFVEEEIQDHFKKQDSEFFSFDNKENEEGRTKEDNDEYKLTDYSSNESSNDGDYNFQWKEEFSSEQKKTVWNFNENKTNGMFYNFSNNFLNEQSSMNFNCFSQDFFNLHADNEINQNSIMFNYNSQNNQNNWGNHKNNFQFLKNEKKEIFDSPIKKQPLPKKKLFCNKKVIPEWAADMNVVKNSIIEQKKNVNPTQIFGEFKIDNLDLRSIFEIGKENYNPKYRGSSANWKNDATTPESLNFSKQASRNKSGLKDRNSIQPSCSRRIEWE